MGKINWEIITLDAGDINKIIMDAIKEWELKQENNEKSCEDLLIEE